MKKINMTRQELEQLALNTARDYNLLLMSSVRRDIQDNLLTAMNGVLDVLTASYDVYYAVCTDDFGQVVAFKNVDDPKNTIHIQSYAPKGF